MYSLLGPRLLLLLLLRKWLWILRKAVAALVRRWWMLRVASLIGRILVLSWRESILSHLLLILKGSCSRCCGSCRCCSCRCCNCSRCCSCCWISSGLWKRGCIGRNRVLLRVIMVTSWRYTGCVCSCRVTVLPLHVVLCCSGCGFLR